jgi:hypothetical protein
MTSNTDIARVLLVGVRLMGTAGLLVPELVIHRLGIDPDTQPAMRYPLRMFGIRTVPIGAGMRWLADTTTTSVILRHHPELRPAMRAVPNAFQAWQRPGVTG